MATSTSNAIARLRELPKQDLLERAARSAASLANLRRQVSESKVPTALKGAAFELLGGGVAGALKAKFPEVAGVPSHAAAGLLIAGIGVGMGSPALIHAGTGSLCVALADFVEDTLLGLEAAPSA